jgi:hypothetical protein
MMEMQAWTLRYHKLVSENNLRRLYNSRCELSADTRLAERWTFRVGLNPLTLTRCLALLFL